MRVADHIRAPVGTEVILDTAELPLNDITVRDALHHVQRFVYVNRIRLVDMFRDYEGL
jgi:hypothetical protein